MGLMGYLNTLLSALTGDVSISSPANLDYLRYVTSTGKWTNTPAVGSEASTTNNSAAANDTVIGTTNRYYSFVTLPSTAPLWLLTGIEWKNGTVVNGTMMAGVDIVDASPPVLNASMYVTQIMQLAASGASSVQRSSFNVPAIVPASTLLGVWVVSNSATHRLLTATVASANNVRAIAFTQGNLTGSSVAWAAGTEQPYMKLYYKPILGV